MGQLRRRLSSGALAFATAATAFTVTAGPARAIGADWYVSTTGDDANVCTTAATPCLHIAHVVDQLAANNDTIHVAAGTYAESEIEIFYNLTIQGATNATSTVSQSGSAIFDVYQSSGAAFPTVNFTNLTISGNTTGDGIYAQSAALTFTNSHVDGNHSAGVDAYGSVITASHSTFSHNGDAAAPNSGDGIYLADGSVSVDHSTVDGNYGFGIFTDPSGSSTGYSTALRLDHSTASNNAFGGVGGYHSSIHVLSSTLSGNSSAGIQNASGVAEVRNSTITRTKPLAGGAGQSAGISSFDLSGTAPSPTSGSLSSTTPTSELQAGEAAVSGSIVASQASGVADCSGTLVDNGYNISSDSANSCAFSSDKRDLSKTKPVIGSLASNGGPTKTHAPLRGSPVIDFIRAGYAGCVKSATDQRGKLRVQPVGGKCDIGAVELAAKPLVIHPSSLPRGTVGKWYAQSITATGGQFPYYTFKVVSGHLPRGLKLYLHGRLAGTPTRANTYSFTVRVNNAVSKTYKVLIAPRS